jgi:hypothetical protein
MTERKSLTKKTRFEVFKRDNFTCQYCGRKAPDVILEIDHIKPVKNGGNNDIINLITSCFECNRGKGGRELKDNSIVEKQRAQIEELNLRRQQLEMMLKWRDGLKKEENAKYTKVIKYYNKLWDDSVLNKDGEKALNKLVDKFGIINVLDAIDVSYKKYNYSGDNESDNFNKVFNKLGGILYLKYSPDHIKKIAYIKGIVRNKFYINEKRASISLMKYYEDGYDLDELINMLKNNEFNHWTSFINYVED